MSNKPDGDNDDEDKDEDDNDNEDNEDEDENNGDADANAEIMMMKTMIPMIMMMMVMMRTIAMIATILNAISTVKSIVTNLCDKVRMLNVLNTSDPRRGAFCLPSKVNLCLDLSGVGPVLQIELNVVALAVVPEKVVQAHHESENDQDEQGQELGDVLEGVGTGVSKKLCYKEKIGQKRKPNLN